MILRGVGKYISQDERDNEGGSYGSNESKNADASLWDGTFLW